MPPPTRLTLSGREFDLVCVRRSGVAVYRGEHEYLRIGPGLEPELEVHHLMLAHGYPVAGIVELGQQDGSTYLIEESLGESTLGDTFAREVETSGCVSDRRFDTFMGVIGRHAQAQLRSLRHPMSGGAFADVVGISGAAANVPEIADETMTAWDAAMSMLEALPATLLHGDLHPYNMCAGGIFDLEGCGWGAVGYDVATAVFVPTLCDSGTGRGAAVSPWFSSSQTDSYLAMLDSIFVAAGVSPPSKHIDALLLCRAVSLCAHVHPRADIWRARREMLAHVVKSFRATGRMPDSVLS